MENYSSSFDINTSGHNSRLLSLESPILPSGSSSSRTGPGGPDLSLSELSISDHTEIMPKPFSLLARIEPDPATPMRSSESTGPEIQSNEHEDAENDEGNFLENVNNEDAQKHAAKQREEKLQSDIFILKKLNASFELFNDALRETGSANQRIAAQLEQTDALLNKYINILSTSEDFARLIFDEQWQGAEADEEALERERIETQERIRREAEAEALRSQQEMLRLEKEKQEALQREEKAHIEREKSERVIRGGIRGVRGTRASMRGMRGSAPSRTDSGSGMARGIPRGRPPSGISRSSRPI